MRKNLRIAAAMMTAGTAAALAGCGGTAAAPGAEGGGGQVNTACSAIEELCAAWAEAFEAETGITVNYTRLSGGEALARITAGRDNTEFDVWQGGSVDSFGQAAADGLIEPYTSPNAKDIDPTYVDPEGYWTGIYVGVLGICSNTAKLEELGVDVPTSWDDLLDPKLKGQVVVAHPGTSSTAYSFLWTQVRLRGSEDAAMEWMRELHPNILQYSKSGTAPGLMAGRGEIAVGVTNSHDCVNYKLQGMKDLEPSFAEEGTGWEIGGLALVADSKNTEAAKKYIDWALTAEAQELGPTVGSYQVPTAPDAPLDPNMADLSAINLIDYDFPLAAERRKDLVQRFTDEIAVPPTS